MFYSVVVELKALETGVIPTYPGKKIHGMFFNVLKKASEEVSKKLHQNFNNKAFTVSSFLGKKVDEPVSIMKNKRYYIRLTFLNEKIFNLFTVTMFKNKIFKKEIYIENIKFSILRVIFDEEQSKWAGVLSIDELLSKKDYSNKIKLKFYTPTLFRVGDKHLRYPDAKKIYTGLLNKFNKYSEYKFNESIKEEFSNIKIINKRIRKKRVFINNFYLEGFVGDVEFEISQGNNELLKIVNILSEFSFYAGIGYKTTMGMGQVRREHKECIAI
ncbi:CRISPR-associated endoribonuclease Cas6 [Marinitoga sp. 1154]|uniref:CRISPR-associated endoribonuclease Cas6 n=1 Tax=Marinitoga sp. 1154 TaxID=1643335 RepID=UPI0034C64519